MSQNSQSNVSAIELLGLSVVSTELSQLEQDDHSDRDEDLRVEGLVIEVYKPGAESRVSTLPSISSLSNEQNQSNQDNFGLDFGALGLQDGLIGARVTLRAATVEKLSIHNVSNDIIHLIIDQLPVAGLVCLGLTCKKFYAFFKSRHPSLPSLLEPVCCIVTDEGEDQACSRECPYVSVKLKDVLRNWRGIGHGYWFLYQYPSIFLKHELYAPPGSIRRADRDGVARLEELIARYHDYDNTNTAWESRGGRRLPNPHNMGDAWYSMAFDVIREDMIQWGSLSDWRNFWTKTSVYHRFKEVLEKDFDSDLEREEADQIANFFSDWLKLEACTGIFSCWSKES